MPAHRKLVSWSIASVLVAAILIALAQHQPPVARAQEDPSEDESEGPPSVDDAVVVGPQGPARFSRAPADPGALQYDDLSEIEKEGTDVAGSIMEAEHPLESVAGWSAVSQQHAERAAVRRAEYEAGLTGMSGLGVE